MKKLIPILFLAALLSGCISSKKYYQKGMYDAAITKSVKKLMKKPTNEKEIYVLEQAYKTANQKDRERIEYLKKTGEPDIWDEVFTLYNTLKNRQDRVRLVSTDILNRIGFKHIDYDQEIIEAKKKAAAYFYAHGLSLLTKGGKLNAREAYYDFQKVKTYYRDYKDVDSKMDEALFMGTNFVLFQIKNQSATVMPKGFEDELLKISLKDISGNWVEYDTYKDNNINYDYTVNLNLKVIDVSPEHVNTREFSDSKEVEDGFQYVLDGNGNVMKDSLGNDIKVPKYKTITCYVTETHLSKSAIVKGSLDYYNNTTRQLIKTDPVTVESIFDHTFAVAKGDLNALKPENKKLVGIRPLPFPNDLEMIFRTNENLKNMTKDILVRNKALLQN